MCQRSPKRKRCTIVFAIAGLIIGSAAHGFQDLIHTWRSALDHDPVYASARAQYRAMQETVPQARAVVLPWLAVGGEASQRDNRAASTFARDASHHRSAWALTLTQPLYNRAAWHALEQSRLMLAEAEITLAMAYQDVMLRSAQAYFDVLAAQDALTVIEAEQASISAQLASARRNFELGNATIIDTHEAQARHDLIIADTLQARHNLDVALSALARLIGATPKPLAPLPHDVTLPAPQPNRLEDWIEQGQSAALAVQRAQLGLRIAERSVHIARSGHAPTLELRASAASASDLNRVKQRSGRGLDSGIGLYLNVPLYTGGLVSSRVTERVALTEKSRHDLEDARRTAVQDARRYFTGVDTGLARIRALQAGETSSLAALAANRTGYEIGVRTNLDVLTAQQQHYATLRDLAQARYTTLMAGLRLRAITGILSVNDLQDINRLLQTPTPLSTRMPTNESSLPGSLSNAQRQKESPRHARPMS